MIDQPRVDMLDNLPITYDLWCDDVARFLISGLSRRYPSSVINSKVKEAFPDLWEELYAIKRELHQILMAREIIATGELFTRLRLWREAALRIEMAMIGIAEPPLDC